MAADVVPLAQVKLPAGPSNLTAEQRYWRSFKNPKSHTSTASWAVTHISFPSPSSSGSSGGAVAVSKSLTTAPRTNDLFAVTAGPRVDVFSLRKRELVKTIGRFESVARSGEIRADGRVLLAGDDGGKMQVFDVAGGGRAAVLKTWHLHKQPVWVTRWSPTGLTELMSASDDKTVRLWSLPEQEPSRVFSGHVDYVRCGGFMPGSAAGSNLLVSGSYDSTVCLWDPRAPGGSVLTFKHAAPVEAVLALPSGTTLVAAAAETISVLDLVAAKPVTVLRNHQKTVTSLALASHGTRVVSGGLDGHAKVFETSGWSVVAGFKYPSPILSVAVISAGAAADDRHLAVGMQSGVLSLRTRLTGSAAERDRTTALELAATATDTADFAALDAARAKRKRGAHERQRMDLVGEGVDVVVAGDQQQQHGRRAPRRERPWQRDLRHGRFGAALDGALDARRADASPLDVLTLLVALRHRSALRAALAGRDEAGLAPLLRWVVRRVADPRYAAVCVDVALHLLDLYAEFAGAGAPLSNEFRRLWRRVRREVEKAQMACQTGGMLESLLVGAVAA